MITTKRRYLDPAPDMRVWLEPDGRVGHYQSSYGLERDRRYAVDVMQRFALNLRTQLTAAEDWILAAQSGKWSEAL